MRDFHPLKTPSFAWRSIDRRKESHHCRLEDFVLDRGDAERPVSAIRLRYKPPTGWQRSIRSGMNPFVKIDETSLKILLVLVPRYPINARSRALLQAEERPPESINVDVVQERCDLRLLVPVNGFTYAALRL